MQAWTSAAAEVIYQLAMPAKASLSFSNSFPGGYTWRVSRATHKVLPNSCAISSRDARLIVLFEWIHVSRQTPGIEKLTLLLFLIPALLIQFGVTVWICHRKRIATRGERGLLSRYTSPVFSQDSLGRRFMMDERVIGARKGLSRMVEIGLLHVLLDLPRGDLGDLDGRADDVGERFCPLGPLQLSLSTRGWRWLLHSRVCA